MFYEYSVRNPNCIEKYSNGMIKLSNRSNWSWILRWIDYVTYGKSPNLNWILATFRVGGSFEDCIGQWPRKLMRKDIHLIVASALIYKLRFKAVTSKIPKNRRRREKSFVYERGGAFRCRNAVTLGLQRMHLRVNWKFWIVSSTNIFTECHKRSLLINL